MTDLESAMLAPMASTVSPPALAAALFELGASSGDLRLPPSEGANTILQDAWDLTGDEWIVLRSASSDAVQDVMISPADEDFADLQPLAGDEEGEEIVITGRRIQDDSYIPYGGGGTGGGSTGGDGGGGAGSPTGVEPHEQDCGSEDGAAVQAAKHVMGVLPEGVAGPPDPVTTASGNDWTKVEFGAVIVRNPDGSFGALNNMIYSSDQAGYAVLPNSTGQPVQGIWHSHPTRDDPAQRAIDRYPSPGDWAGLARIAGQAGAASDPSLWITAPDGVTREFRLSERGYYENLARDPSRMVNGEGLEGKERTQACA